MSEAADDMLEALKGGDKDQRIPIGLADLDRDTGGWRRGEYAILGGRPSMGKSAVAVALGRRAAKAGHGVLIFSLEMTTRAWMARMATDASWRREGSVAYSSALRGVFQDRESVKFSAGLETLRDLPILVEEQAGLTAADIASRTRNAAEVFGRQGKRLGLVIVDHLGLVRPSSRYKGQKVHEVAEVSQAMAQLAKNENVAVLCLHQLNRAVEGRDNKRPTLADLRDTGNLEQDADVVMFAYRPAYYLERLKFDEQDKECERLQMLQDKRNVLEISIAKQRNGPTNNIELYCDMASNAVRNKAWGIK
jgi:replicative DNA helicase